MYNYYNNSNNYQQQIAQDILQWSVKLLICNLIPQLVCQEDRKETKNICNLVSGVIDCINPPKSDMGQVLSIITNGYNLVEYIDQQAFQPSRSF